VKVPAGITLLTETAFSPLSMAILALASCLAGAGAAALVALWRAGSTPREDLTDLIEHARMRLEAERAKDVAAMAKYVEEVSGLATTIKRHRLRIDGAEGAEQQQREREQATPAQPSNLSDVMRMARARGMMQ